MSALIAEEPLQRTCKIVAAYRLPSERIIKLPDPRLFDIAHLIQLGMVHRRGGLTTRRELACSVCAWHQSSTWSGGLSR